MSEAKKVAVVILGWNGKKFLEQFLPSVVQHTLPDLCEIIVADNCSTDDSVQFVQTHYPRVRVIKNATNSGFAGGYNEALKQVHTEYYVLLNQDVEVTENWVEKVIAEMERDKTIAAAQPKLRDYNKREYFEYAGGSGGYLDRNSYAFCRGRIFNTIEKDNGQYDDVRDIFWATGACMFVRAEAYWKAGALDQDFFAHQEEIDLCWRIKNMGLRIIAVPSSIVYHVGGGSLPQGNPRKTYLNFRNNLMMMFKNLPASTLVPRLFWRFILDGVAALHSVFKNKNFKDLNAILKAHFSFYAAVPSLLEKRRKLPHNSAAHLTNINLLWQHFVKGKKKFSEL